MKKRLGIALLEVILTMGIFAIVSVGVYSAITLIFKIVYQSRVRILATSVINEEIEFLRSLSFYDVGILNGSPAGILPREAVRTAAGIDFDIIRTIRSVDDPFDGTIGGTPNDTAPADYKLISIDVSCPSCGQSTPLSFTSTIAPRYLEGDPEHGALFIEVFDANAQPVQGATVHVISSSTEPTYDFKETTDNQGLVRLVDMASGIGVYEVIVTRQGFTTDTTYFSTTDNPQPVRPPASVVAQNLTEVSFSIDRVSDMGIRVVDEFCQVVPNAEFTIRGNRLIGVSPNVHLVSTTVVTGGAGTVDFVGVPWDVYNFDFSNHSLMGTIPQFPVSVLPGVSQPVTIVVGTPSANSLLVSVRDSVTGQPVPEALVEITPSAGLGQSGTTGVGFINQTNWVGGNNQLMFTDETRYYDDDGNVDTLSSPGNLSLREFGGVYIPSGSLESSIFDLGISPTYGNIVWNPFSQNPLIGDSPIRFQLATDSTSTPPVWGFVGPGGVSTTFYTATTTAIDPAHNLRRYLRYKVFLDTATTTLTPSLSDVQITYTNSCTPPGQVFFDGVSPGVYDISVSKNGYETRLYEDQGFSGAEVLEVELLPL